MRILQVPYLLNKIKMNRILIAIGMISLFMIGCNGDGDDCRINQLSLSIGECNCTDHYELTIDFEVDNPTSEFFEVFLRNNESIGIFRISDLPVTIDQFPVSDADQDFVRFCIEGI